MLPEIALRAHLERYRDQIGFLTHPACRSSAESAQARASAGFPQAIGAKALIAKQADSFTMLVLPGTRRLDSKKVRALIGKYRFATPEEVLAITGLEIGTIPPFTRTVLPNVTRLIIDCEIGTSDLIGFNAAHLERSIVMPGALYLAAAQPDQIVEISVAEQFPEHVASTRSAA